jgi:thioredoxin 1
MAVVRHIKSAAEFQQLIASASLTVVDFFATWCGPCRMIAPKVEQFANQYNTVTFCKVDVDELDDVAARAGISAMPTFQFYKGGKKVDELLGADPNRLEALIKKHHA